MAFPWAATGEKAAIFVREETEMIGRWLPTPTRAGHLLLGVLLVLALVAVGCSSSSSLPKTYKVTGKVTSKTGQSLEKAGIEFRHLDDTSFAVSGEIGSDGTFSLHTVKGKERASGAPAGKYKVTIQPPISHDQKRSPPIEWPQPIEIKPEDNNIKLEIPPGRGS